MQAKRRLSEQGMSAFGRGTVRTLLLSGLSVVPIALVAGLGFADAQSPMAPSAADLSGAVPILSPEKPPKFGDLSDASPLFVVFTAGHVARGPALEASGFAEPKLDLASAAAHGEAP